jgi:response regulator RpfG family c-di-GMP phosphodiesterase
MGWADWMVINQSLEEELEVERSVREVNNCTDEEALKMLCSALVRQSWHQQKLLSQACTRIGELDAKLACWD